MARDTVASITHEELRTVLQRYVLPRLSVTDLTSLTSTCRVLQDTVAELPAGVWQDQLRQQLPWHPLVDPGRAAAVAAVARYKISSANLSSNRHALRTLHEVPAVPNGYTLSMSPDHTVVAQWGYYFPPALVVHDVVAHTQHEMPHTPEYKPARYTVRQAAWQADSRRFSLLTTPLEGLAPPQMVSYNVHMRQVECLQSMAMGTSSSVFSPDGRSVASASAVDGPSHLCVLSFDAEAPVHLADSALEPDADVQFLWAANSARLAALTDRMRFYDACSGAVLLELDAQHPTLINLNLSRDRRYRPMHAWCWHGSESLLLFHAAGDGESHQITRVSFPYEGLSDVSTAASLLFPGLAPEAVHCRGLQLSPDGTWLSITAKLGTDRTYMLHTDRTVVADLSSGTCQVYEHAEHDRTDCMWSPCSRYLTCIHKADSQTSGHVMSFEVSVGFGSVVAATELATSPCQVQWAADRSALFMVAEANHVDVIGGWMHQVVKEAWHVCKIDFVDVSHEGWQAAAATHLVTQPRPASSDRSCVIIS